MAKWAFCLSVVLAFCKAGAAFALTSITVLADNTMNVAMTELAREYSRTSHVIVNASFATSQEQEKQIFEGGAADILVTPNAKWIDALRMRGVVDVHSGAPVAHNRLVLVGPVNSPLQVSLAKAFPTAAIIEQMASEPNFVIGNPQTQAAGIYGKEALRNMGVLGEMEPYTLYIKPTAEMLEMVTKQHAYGIFLYSTVVGKEGVKILDTFPGHTHQPVVYYAVVIAGENMDEARKFVSYLNSTEAQKILGANGLNVN